jgi:excisionase family DNA binding protein
MNPETGSHSESVQCQYISLQGFAELLGVPYETVRKWRARGELPHTIVLPNGQIRMSLADVDLWLEGRTA